MTVATLSARAIAASALLWGGAVVVGFALLGRYEGTPGLSARVSDHWPAGAPFALDPSRHTLLLFAHPKCPCTRATLEELDRIVARSSDRLRVFVWFCCDPSKGQDAAWAKTDTWERVARIPGVTVGLDVGGATARLFGAATSGDVFLFAPDGRCEFEGGITSARGHAGDNAGEDAIVARAAGETSDVEHTPVFGCGLIDCSTRGDRDP